MAASIINVFTASIKHELLFTRNFIKHIPSVVLSIWSCRSNFWLTTQTPIHMSPVSLYVSLSWAVHHCVLFSQLWPELWWLPVSVFSTLRRSFLVLHFLILSLFIPTSLSISIACLSRREIEKRIESESAGEKRKTIFVVNYYNTRAAMFSFFLHWLKWSPSKLRCNWSAYWTVLLHNFFTLFIYCRERGCVQHGRT